MNCQQKVYFLMFAWNNYSDLWYISHCNFFIRAIIAIIKQLSFTLHYHSVYNSTISLPFDVKWYSSSTIYRKKNQNGKWIKNGKISYQHGSLSSMLKRVAVWLQELVQIVTTKGKASKKSYILLIQSSVLEIRYWLGRMSTKNGNEKISDDYQFRWKSRKRSQFEASFEIMLA